MEKNPFEILCEACGEILYKGTDIKPAKDVLKHIDFKCKKCGAPLSVTEFILEVADAD